MANITIKQDGERKFTIVGLKGPKGELILAGTNLPEFEVKRDVIDEPCSLTGVIVNARASARSHKGWKVVLLFVKTNVKRGPTATCVLVYEDNIGAQKAKSERWVRGFPYYADEEGNPSRFDSTLVDKALAANGVVISRDDSERVDFGLRRELEKLIP